MGKQDILEKKIILNNSLACINKIEDEKKVKQMRQSLSGVPAEVQKEDLIPFEYRLISKSHVGKGSWKSTDFSEGNVLKESLTLLKESPLLVVIEHWDTVKNTVGYVTNPRWKNGYTHQGKPVPAGIEATVWIDKQVAPELVRKMSWKVPLRSGSISLIMQYKYSHSIDSSAMPEIGEIMPDGREFCYVATRISEYNEYSMVFAGADESAKQLDKDGKIMFSKGDDTNDLFIINLSQHTPDNEEASSNETSNKQNQSNEEEKDKTLLLEQSKKKITELSATIVENDKLIAEKTAELAKIEAAYTKQLDVLIAEKTAYTNQINDLNETIALNADKVSYADKLIEGYQEQAKQAFAKLNKGHVSEAVTKTIEGTYNIDVLKSMILAYNGELADEFGFKCNDCNGCDYTFSNVRLGKNNESQKHDADDFFSKF